MPAYSGLWHKSAGPATCWDRICLNISGTGIMEMEEGEMYKARNWSSETLYTHSNFILARRAAWYRQTDRQTVRRVKKWIWNGTQAAGVEDKGMWNGKGERNARRWEHIGSSASWGPQAFYPTQGLSRSLPRRSQNCPLGTLIPNISPFLDCRPITT